MAKSKGTPYHQPGEPIPQEIAARMTQPKISFMHQIVVRLADRSIVPVGPRLEHKPIAEECLSAIKKSIAMGQERTWFDPQIITVQI